MTASKQDLEETEAIKAVIQAFFDRINDSDADGLAKLFEPNSNLTIMRQDPPRAQPATHKAWFLRQPQTPIASNVSCSNKEEKLTVVLRTTIETFVAMIKDGEKRRKPGSGPKVHEVPELDATDVKIDELFAMAWSPFSVTFDGVLHHYGTFVYTFGKVEDEWKLEGLTQTYRRTVGWEGTAGSEFVSDN